MLMQRPVVRDEPTAAKRAARAFGLTAMVLCACEKTTELTPAHAPLVETPENPSPALSPQSPEVNPNPTGPEPWDPGRLPSGPEGAIDVTPREPNRCVAQLDLFAEVVGGEVVLRATLASNSESSVSVTLSAPCPGGPVAFSGLGDGFDYYGTCNVGACQDANGTVTVVLPDERRRVEIASTTFPIAGDTCRPGLSGGSHHLYGEAHVLSPEGATICGSAFTKLILPETERKSAAPRRVVSCPPQPVCGLACPSGGFARDKNGCPLCACRDAPPGAL